MPFTKNEPNNFDFVQFLKPEYFIDSERKRKPDDSYYGYLEIEVKAVDDLFIGSGMSIMEKEDIFAETMHEDGKLIIPGSSLKGAVRHICRAVSESCIPDAKISDEYKLECTYQTRGNKKKPPRQEVCIVCDMFGNKSLGSKIRFTDLTADNDDMVKKYVPQQFAPDKTTKNYKWENDGTHIGYKFYKTYCDKRNYSNGVAIKAAKAGTKFNGRVYFNYLYERELQLLLFALAQNHTFSLKLGGYKADGLGTVNIYCRKFVLKGEEQDPASARSFAQKYEQYVDEKYDGWLDKMIRILEYKE